MLVHIVRVSMIILRCDKWAACSTVSRNSDRYSVYQYIINQKKRHVRICIFITSTFILMPCLAEYITERIPLGKVVYAGITNILQTARGQ